LAAEKLRVWLEQANVVTLLVALAETLTWVVTFQQVSWRTAEQIGPTDPPCELFPDDPLVVPFVDAFGVVGGAKTASRQQMQVLF
jgi:hypothetical protein